MIYWNEVNKSWMSECCGLLYKITKPNNRDCYKITASFLGYPWIEKNNLNEIII
jgi:hypothetical protein